MSYSLNSFNRGYTGDYIGSIIGVIKGDTRSLDSSSCEESKGGWEDVLYRLEPTIPQRTVLPRLNPT